MRSLRRVSRTSPRMLVEPVLDHLVLVELIEEMGAALQVEAEIDLLVGQPGRHARHGGAGNRLGSANRMPAKTTPSTRISFHLGKMQHCRLSKLQIGLFGGVERLDRAELTCHLPPPPPSPSAPGAASPLPRTSETVPRTTLICGRPRRSRPASSWSSTLVTLPMMPPEVTTVSPRRIAGDHRLMLLQPLLLRPDHQEIHDADD